MSLPTLVFAGPACVCSLAWVGAGLAVPRRWLSGEALLDWLTRLAVGSVLISLALFAMGRAHLFDRIPVVVGTVALALVGLGTVVRRRPRVPSSLGHDRLAWTLLGTVGLALVIDLIAATAPPTSADALKYHLALPKLWFQLGGIPDTFWSWLSFGPSSIEMLYAQGLAVGGGSTASALHALLTVCCAAAVFGLGREIAGDALGGVVAAFVFVVQGIVTWEATSAFVELGLSFYIVLAVWHAMRWSRDGSLSAAACIGLLAGAAAGTKYLGLLAAVVVLGVFGVAAVLRRRPAHAAIAGAIAVAFGGAWYMKNALVTGNPVYPLFFGGRWVTPFGDKAIHSIGEGYGLPSGLLRLPLLPADLLVQGAAFDRGQYVGSAIFVGAVAALFVCRTQRLAILLAGCLLYLIVWDVQAPQARFLLPVLGVLAGAAGASATSLLRAGGRRRRAVLAVLALTAVAWLAATAALTRQLLPVTVGLESRPAFLQRLTGTYDALMALRARSPGALAVAGYPLTFNVPGRTFQVGVTEFGPTLSRRTYVARLNDLGIDRLVVANTPGTADLIDPVRACLKEIAVFQARFVTSRARGTGTPMAFRLYSLAGCRADS